MYLCTNTIDVWVRSSTGGPESKGHSLEQAKVTYVINQLNTRSRAVFFVLVSIKSEVAELVWLSCFLTLLHQ